MEIMKKQDKKNEKEEKSLQTGKNADKFPLDDELLDAVSGGIAPINTVSEIEYHLAPGKF